MLMDLPHLTVIDTAEWFLKQHVPFFSRFSFQVLQCGNASDCSQVSERKESSSDGKRRLLQISGKPPRDQCLIAARTLIAGATKPPLTTLSLISLAREQILQHSDWGHPSAHVLLSAEHWRWRTKAGSRCARCKCLIWSHRDLNQMHEPSPAVEDAPWQKVKENTSESSKYTALIAVLEESWQARDHPSQSIYEGLLTVILLKGSILQCLLAADPSAVCYGYAID